MGLVEGLIVPWCPPVFIEQWIRDIYMAIDLQATIKSALNAECGRHLYYIVAA
jgi:hypothetical protein